MKHKKNTSENTVLSKPKNIYISRLGDILHDSDGILSLVKLNILFIFSSGIIIPPLMIITLGPALTAMLFCTNEMVIKGHVSPVYYTYMTTYKKLFRKTIPYGAIATISTFVFLSGLLVYMNLVSENILYLPFASVSLLLLILLWCTLTHIFPALCDDKYPDKTIKENFIFGFSLFIVKMKGTLISVIVSTAIIAAVIMLLPVTLPLLLTLAFSVPALCGAFAHSDPEIPEL